MHSGSRLSGAHERAGRRPLQGRAAAGRSLDRPGHGYLQVYGSGVMWITALPAFKVTVDSS